MTEIEFFLLKPIEFQLRRTIIIIFLFHITKSRDKLLLRTVGVSVGPAVLKLRYAFYRFIFLYAILKYFISLFFPTCPMLNQFS